MFASDYLEILPGDSAFLNGLHWSEAHAYLEYSDDKTFALVFEVFAFLEGFGSQRPLMHFGLVLHFLYVLRHGRGPKAWHDFSVLSEAWKEAARPARLAGVLCAQLCLDIPPVSDPPGAEELSVWLSVCSRTTADGYERERPHEKAPFCPVVFEAMLAACSKDTPGRNWSTGFVTVTGQSMTGVRISLRHCSPPSRRAWGMCWPS